MQRQRVQPLGQAVFAAPAQKPGQRAFQKSIAPVGQQRRAFLAQAALRPLRRLRHGLARRRVQLQLRFRARVALQQLLRRIPGGQPSGACLGCDQLLDFAQRFFQRGGKQPSRLGRRFLPGRLKRAAHQRRHALAVPGADRIYRRAQRRRQPGNIQPVSPPPGFIHHIQCHHHGRAQFPQLQR